jgi:hypothetical protein
MVATPTDDQVWSTAGWLSIMRRGNVSRDNDFRRETIEAQNQKLCLQLKRRHDNGFKPFPHHSRDTTDVKRKRKAVDSYSSLQCRVACKMLLSKARRS